MGAEGRVRTLHHCDVGERLDLGDHRVDRRFDGRIGHRGAVGGVEDDPLLVAGQARGGGLQEVQCLGRLGVREGEAVGVGGAYSLREERHADEGGDPQQDDDESVSDAPGGEGLHGRTAPVRLRGR